MDQLPPSLTVLEKDSKPNYGEPAKIAYVCCQVGRATGEERDELVFATFR